MFQILSIYREYFFIQIDLSELIEILNSVAELNSVSLKVVIVVIKYKTKRNLESASLIDSCLFN